MSNLNAFHANAIILIGQEVEAIPALRPALDALMSKELQVGIQAGLEDFLSNPFVQSAMKLLRSFQSNYKISQAVRLLEEAGKEYSDEKNKKRRR